MNTTMNLKEQKENLSNLHIEARKKYASRVEELISSALKENWVVDAIDITRVEVYLVDPVDNKPVFGHKFTLGLYDRYNHETLTRNYTLEANIGTMGSFDVQHDFKQMQLYAIFASLISDEKLMAEVKDVMIEYDGYKHECWKKCHEIDEQLKNA